MILYGLCTIVTAAALVASFPSLRPRHVISDIVERGVESQPQASRESLLVATPQGEVLPHLRLVGRALFATFAELVDQR
jgi:hypothetical protein